MLLNRSDVHISPLEKIRVPPVRITSIVCPLLPPVTRCRKRIYVVIYVCTLCSVLCDFKTSVDVLCTQTQLTLSWLHGVSMTVCIVGLKLVEYVIECANMTVILASRVMK